MRLTMQEKLRRHNGVTDRRALMLQDEAANYIDLLLSLLQRERREYAELHARFEVIRDAATNHAVRYFKGKIKQ